MSTIDKVRFSRDGDQFHYLWAARRCLGLLAPDSGLVAVSIEGASLREVEPGDPVAAGEEVIDIAEYYGSEEIEKASFVRYLQLKHSTQHPNDNWVPSGLKKTIKGFSDRYRELERRFGAENLKGRFDFGFVSNRPILPSFLETIEDAISGVATCHPENLKKLKEFTSLNDSQLKSFCHLLKLEGRHQQYRLQRDVLGQEIKGYLVGDDVDAPVRLKELVTRKALSESAQHPTITKSDVLRALNATEDRLFPAPLRIESADTSIPRTQESDLVAHIMESSNPVIIHATGGVGKSIFSQRIAAHLPEGSVSIVYDCFGNGEYRRLGSPRHRHKDALVQIVNELATNRLCDPLIPSPAADNTDYLRAFIQRLKQCVASIRGGNEQALVCIAIDAADNAEMAAKEFGDERSFARDLIREDMPDGVRLVALCRTERRDYLDPPPTVLHLELKPFSRIETAAFLRGRFADASENDIDEFHRLTSCNPRVQANALAQELALPDILRALGPDPTTVDAAIASQLELAISEVRDRADKTERAQIDKICTGLALLRPLVPISVLASLSGVDASAIRSFATDLGRPLLVSGDAVQFRDEPVETWFRERFRATGEQLTSFIEILQSLAGESAYVASSLPALMLEAGQLSELVALALSASKLPVDNPIEKRDVELQRLQFALKASLRANRYVDAAKLALKAGEETAGDTRQQDLIQDNTDLIAVLLDPDRIQEIVSRRIFGGGWLGVHHAYEASLLSHVDDFKGDARSRLRMAYEWLAHWSRLPKEDREEERITDDDIAEIGVAQFNLHGAAVCAAELRRWSPWDLSFRVGKIIASRLVDHGRYDDLNALAVDAGNNIFLILAVTQELSVVHRTPPKEVVQRALRLLLSGKIKLQESSYHHEATVLQAIVAFTEVAHAYGLRSNDALTSLLDQYLPRIPPRGLARRYGEQRYQRLYAYSLRAALNGEELKLVDLAHPDLRKQLEDNKSHQDSQEVREFKEDIGALLPWHILRASSILSQIDLSALRGSIAETLKHSMNAERSISYRDVSDTSDEIAEIWFDIIARNSEYSESLLTDFQNWLDGLRSPLASRTWIKMSRLAARTPGLEQHAYGFAQKAFEQTRAMQEEAQTKAQTYVEIARALLSVDRLEANEYFSRAVEVSSKIGDEISDRWQALLDLAEQAADPGRHVPEAAYRLARCAEVAREYLHKHFDWQGTTRAIHSLSPSSGLAILSRWRDRHFGWMEELLPTAIHFLLEHRYIDLISACALLGFRGQWRYHQLLDRALAACRSQPEQQVVTDYVLRYMRLEECSVSAWQEVDAVSKAHALSIPDIDRLVEFSTRREQSLKNTRETYASAGSALSHEEAALDWESVFSDLELHTVNGLSSAYANFKCNDTPWQHKLFWTELISRIAAGKEAELVKAVSEAGEVDLYLFRSFIEQLPEKWTQRMAVKRALSEAIQQILRRHCLEITINRRYQLLPLKTASELSGLPETELIDTVLVAIGQQSETLEARRLFTLVGLLASKLSHDEALEALNFGLGLFEDVLDEEDGDGAWSAFLAPPPDMDEAVAGYLWAALGAPEADLRWQAAHVVRGLCALGRRETVDYLIQLASGSTAGSFADSRLHFYHLHARLWLMIALARSSLESPEVLATHSKFLVHYALHDEPHVLIRHFAASAALALEGNGFVQLDAGVSSQLRAVNVSALPVVPLKRHDLHRTPTHPVHPGSGSERFTFGDDMSRYWFGSLGNCFAKTPAEIGLEVEQVILDDWKLTYNGHWNMDERRRRGLYRDRETMHSHGSYPRTDNLNFYLSYHGMFTAAGKLLAAVPLHQAPDEQERKFDGWLNQHLLSRKDGRWLADRRDPKPFEWPTWKDKAQDENWRWSVSRPDFDRLLGIGNGRLNLWGCWNAISESREELVRVYSALVSPDHSTALLRALQTATNPYSYYIPDAGDEREINKAGFRLEGWVENRYCESNLDKFDPWAGDIQYPSLGPAQFVRDLLLLTSDSEFKVWRRQTDRGPEEVLWSQVWGSFSRDNDQSKSERGRRLQTTHAFMTDVLAEMDMDLIIQVEIERQIRRNGYGRYTNDGYEYIPPYFKLFLLRRSGEFDSI